MKGLSRISLFLTAIICLTCLPVLATTWAPAEKIDPISGEITTVHVIASYGNYIYSWPSKYDLIFWPLMDENWIWFNTRSGYAAFGSDFDKLSDAEKKSLSAWLKANYNPNKAPDSLMTKLAWLERIYSQRRTDDDFWCVFYRLMAYVHESDKKTSLEYVKKALPLLAKKLETNTDAFKKIEYLYLLGEYHRRVGESGKAKEYFQQAKTAKYKDESGKEQVGHPYILELIADREKLMNGGSPGTTSRAVTDQAVSGK